jgi:hypothetical protein
MLTVHFILVHYQSSITLTLHDAQVELCVSSKYRLVHKKAELCELQILLQFTNVLPNIVRCSADFAKIQR